ncbi:sensor histidine kinase [Aliikangiella coralliicola]|uniref:Sensor histidine kinase n=1 Tax=Aliikangiella coralliicola TaxID=2592383 RepID=A0A545UG12_9GAMM|nr:histidine kinase [Aliikangiella coralliicola]TQV88410.1 sensor histidine kinase [Aliikangiella coralliicola]
MSEPQSKLKNSDFFLPDFCQVQSVFLVLLAGELLAVLFTFLNAQPQSSLWNLLGLYSISIQIVSLFSVACLCLLRPYMTNYSDWISGILSLLVVLVTTLIFSLSVIRWYWLQPIDLGQQAQSHMVIRNLFIAGLIGSVVLRYFYLLQQYRQQVSLEASARLQALQARIRPHFLFNSMNVIASLTRVDPAKAESAIEDLSDLFRATLENKQELIPFAKELENTERYLSIEKLRLGYRLLIEKDIQREALEIMVPPLSMQPLLENAVYHGIQNLPDGGIVKLSAVVSNKELVIEVTNPVGGERASGGHGMALRNITQRLEVIYNGKAQLARSSENNLYRVSMRIPVKKPDF